MAVAVAAQDGVAVLNLHWYAGLNRPSFAPGPWLAAVTSVALGGALATAFYRVLRRPDYLPDRPAAIRAFLVALALDVAWAWLFFGGRHPTVALAAAAVLLIAACVACWRCTIVDGRAGLLLAFWALAAGFAFLLDLSISQRNA